MQPNRFVVLTGHLNHYPLSDLVGILKHQKKTGRLLIEYPKGPATLFFEDGELIDAQLNELSGLQAVCVAMSLPESAFNFNPLVKATRRSIAPSMRRVVSELLGCWDESALQIEATVVEKTAQPVLTAKEEEEPIALPPRTEPLALPAAPSITIPRRYFFMASAAVLVMIGFSIVIAMSVRFGSARRNAAVAPSVVPVVKQEDSVKLTTPEPVKHPSVRDLRALRLLEQHRQEQRLAENAPESSELVSIQSTPSTTSNAEKNKTDSAPLQSVHVVMQIENGRILKASVANHRPGMDNYEALALRIARQRRYPDKVTGEETVKISVARPN